jgi:hypothetical protein
MPFDGTETPALRRARLIEVLRSPMPNTWKWDFGVTEEEHECGTAGCALGLARQLWPEMNDFHAIRDREAAFFGITKDQAFSVFFGPYRGCFASVTPEMVADRLEAIDR